MNKMSLNSELAEIIGMHVGDGYLRYLGPRKDFDLSGNYEEKDYYDNYIVPLFSRAFGIEIKAKFFPSRGTYGFQSYNPNLIKKLASFGFPSGNKTTTIFIPQEIIKSNDLKIMTSFLRGYFDTDGSFTCARKVGNPSEFQQKYNYYPRIMFTTCSQKLKDDLVLLFQRLKFKYSCSTYQPKIKTESLKCKLQITGKSAISRWMEIIGSNNHTKKSRYLIWKKFGFCPPKTTYPERLNILSGKLDPESFYGPMV